MKRIFYIIILVVLFSCRAKQKQEETTTSVVDSFVVKTVDYNQLKPLLEKKDNKTYVVNFWATWCAPCVKELPYFEKINSTYKSKNVEVLLVSLDFPRQIQKKLIPYIKNNNLQSEVVLLDDPNENYWINAIDKNWSGALPATLIYNKTNRKFYEQTFDYTTLKNELLSFLNP